MLRAIVPVAGVGTRLRPHTFTLPKVLIHVAGKPILGHILDQLKLIDVTEVVLVVGYMGDMVVEYVKENYDFSVKFVNQEDLLGLGHAILLTESFCKDDPALIVLGDTIFRADFSEIFDAEYSSIGVKEVVDPKRFGIVELQGDSIRSFVEKPENPPTNLAIVGLYYIRNSPLLFECLNRLVENGQRTAGEFQLTDALQDMLNRGEEMRPFKVEGWYDCGKPETLLDTNRKLLGFNGSYPEEMKRNNIIHEPVYIARSAKVEDSIIGPYVSIAGGSVVQRSILCNTILNENTIVKNVNLEESIVGREADISGKVTRINLGDCSQLDMA